MSDIFERYERHYCELSTSLTKKIANAVVIAGDQKKHVLQELQKGLEEAEALIRKMDLEARSLPATQKSMLVVKLREYKTDLTNLKRDVKKTSAPDTSAERDELMETGLGADLSVSADQRARLLSNTARLNESSERIQSGKRQLMETEELGVSILQDLHKQREVLLHTRETLHGVDNGLGRSRQILNNMARRMSRNKIMIGGIIAVLLLAIGIVIYSKVRH